VGCLAQLMPAAGGPGAIMVLEQVCLLLCHPTNSSAHTMLDKLPIRATGEVVYIRCLFASA